MQRIKLALIAGVLATGLPAGGAQAMPVSNLAAVDTAAAPQEVRWICNWRGRCWWRPNRWYRPYAYYGGPRWRHRHWGHRHWGHRHWRRW
jgi:hypothetical protein